MVLSDQEYLPSPMQHLNEIYGLLNAMLHPKLMTD